MGEELDQILVQLLVMSHCHGVKVLQIQDYHLLWMGVHELANLQKWLKNLHGKEAMTVVELIILLGYP